MCGGREGVVPEKATVLLIWSPSNGHVCPTPSAEREREGPQKEGVGVCDGVDGGGEEGDVVVYSGDARALQGGGPPRVCRVHHRGVRGGAAIANLRPVHRFPRVEDTVPILLGLQKGGADIIEVGMPFSDPLADGATIQKANEVRMLPTASPHGAQVALAQGVTMRDTLRFVKTAREQGLTVPVVIMGCAEAAAAAGADTGRLQPAHLVWNTQGAVQGLQ